MVSIIIIIILKIVVIVRVIILIKMINNCNYNRCIVNTDGHNNKFKIVNSYTKRWF